MVVRPDRRCARDDKESGFTRRNVTMLPCRARAIEPVGAQGESEQRNTGGRRRRRRLAAVARAQRPKSLAAAPAAAALDVEQHRPKHALACARECLFGGAGVGESTAARSRGALRKHTQRALTHKTAAHNSRTYAVPVARLPAVPVVREQHVGRHEVRARAKLVVCCCRTGGVWRWWWLEWGAAWWRERERPLRV